jgi:rod shape-determining protein MreD
VSLALGVLVIVGAALAQVSVLPAFSIFGVQPNLVIVVLVAWLAVRGQREALVLIPVAGILVGILDSQPLGLALLALAPLGLMTEVREARPVESDLVLALVFVALATLFYEGALLLTLAVTGGRADWLGSALNVLVPAVFANVLLLLPTYALLRLTNLNFRPRPAY